MHEIHALVSGFVQGVGFRYSTVRYAKSLGLTGFVRNLADGRVEVLAQGKREALEKMREWLQGGPHSASVEHVEVQWGEPEKKFKSFEVKF